MKIARRTLLLAVPSSLAIAALPVLAESDERIHVVKDPGCPCCNAWIGHLRENGFNVSFEERSVEDLAAYKRERGIPEDLASCHTATNRRLHDRRSCPRRRYSPTCRGTTRCGWTHRSGYAVRFTWHGAGDGA